MSDIFSTEYKNLNPEQKLAVDTIEGPVMVIAGAGTGKTQTIALRIANIIKNTQTPASSILCLTFTDTATITMRKRLVSIIGSQAYLVKINTFHAFCNDIIQDNPEYFIFAPNLKSLDSLSRLQIVQNLINQLPNGSPLKPWGDHFHYQREIISSIQTLKRENITPSSFKKLIEDVLYFIDNSKDIHSKLKTLRTSKTLESELLSLYNDLSLIPNLSTPIHSFLNYHFQLFKSGFYLSGPAKNPNINFKNALLKLIDNFSSDIPKQNELFQLYQSYQKTLTDQGFYDFDDMILFVLQAFSDHTELLLRYQETYQYILVDEYQDTNSAQNKIIENLGSYFDNPNLFVVGDDDQSIFRFQGAAIENIYRFYQKYSPKLIILRNNYRSHQLILDSSLSVINHNQSRIANYISHLDKSLKSVSTLDADPINLFSASNNLEENYYIAHTIENLIKTGTKPNQIAILYRQHTDITDIAEMLTNFDINFYLASDRDILKDPLFIQINKLFQFIDDPTKSDLLYHILSAPFIKINSQDLLKLFRFSKKLHTPLWQLISDPKLLSQITPALNSHTLIKLKNYNLRLAKSRHWLEIYPIDRFFNLTIRKFKILSYILSQKDVEILNKLKTFYSEIKRLSQDIPNFTLTDFLSRLQLLSDNNLPLPVPPGRLQSEDSVQLMTVHSAKGLEFEHVFLVKVVDKHWGNNRNHQILRLPPGILQTEISSDLYDQNEDERRLFYVALTRAKSQIYISYSSQNDNSRPQIPSLFISEINPKLIQNIDPPDNIYQQALTTSFPLKLKKPNISGKYKEYLLDYLSNNYQFNVTHLNSYLKCPFCFYHQTILRIPAAKNKYSSFGTAFHDTLSFILDKLNHQQPIPGDKMIFNFFKESLLKENLSSQDVEESIHRAKNSLLEYVHHYAKLFPRHNQTEYNFASEHLMFENIPLTGKIDLVSYKSNNSVELVDFKTGNPDTKSKELSPDGEYFRQLVFYYLLVSLSSRLKVKIDRGVIDFVQKSKIKNTFVRRDFEINPKHIDKLKQEIKDTYKKILNLDFFTIGSDCKDHMKIHYLLEKSKL